MVEVDTADTDEVEVCTHMEEDNIADDIDHVVAA